MFETSVVTLDGIGHFFIPEFPEPPFIFGPCFKAGWEAGWQPAVYEKDDNKVFNRLRLPASWRLLCLVYLIFGRCQASTHGWMDGWT